MEPSPAGAFDDLRLFVLGEKPRDAEEQFALFGPVVLLVQVLDGDPTLSQFFSDGLAVDPLPGKPVRGENQDTLKETLSRIIPQPVQRWPRQEVAGETVVAVFLNHHIVLLPGGLPELGDLRFDGRFFFLDLRRDPCIQGDSIVCEGSRQYPNPRRVWSSSPP